MAVAAPGRPDGVAVLPLLLAGLLLCERLHAHAKDHLSGALGQASVQLLPVPVGLVLVRDERVLLAVAAQVDALAELLHLREVLDPVGVDRAQEHPALHVAHELGTDLLLLGVVGLIDQLPDALQQVLRLETLRGYVAREQRTERGTQLLEVALLLVDLGLRGR